MSNLFPGWGVTSNNYEGDSKKVPQKYQKYKHTYPKKYLECKKYTQNNTQNAKKYTQKYRFTVYLSWYSLETKQHLLHYRLA